MGWFQEKHRLYRRYGPARGGYLIYIFKSLWINCLRKEQIFRWTNQVLWIANRNFQSSKNPWYFGITEQAEFTLLCENLHPGDTFYDIGANTGLYSHFLAGHKDVYCIQFEPDEDAAAFSRRIAVLNHRERNHLFLSIALGNRDGQAEFSTDSGINNKITNLGKTKIVEIRKLDQLKDLPSPTAIKIDTEGHETEVLKGGISVLASPELRLVILEYDPLLFEECHRILSSSGFQIWSGTQEKPYVSQSGNLIYIRK